jgi:hypothetical protein
MSFIFASIISILSISLPAQDLNDYKKEIFTKKDRYLPYRILFPLAFDTSKPNVPMWFKNFKTGRPLNRQ